jgi:hypothetical protein
MEEMICSLMVSATVPPDYFIDLVFYVDQIDVLGLDAHRLENVRFSKPVGHGWAGSAG